HELKLVYQAADAHRDQRDDRLIQLLAKGRAAWIELQQRSASINATRRSHLVRMARLHFLAPDIVTAIAEGRHPVELTTRSLLRVADLPLDWKGQRKQLGFA